MNNEAGSGFRPALQRTADGFQAFAHAAQAVAFRSVGAAAVVGDFERAQLFVAGQADGTLLRLRVAHHVGHGFAQRQRQHRLLCRAERNGGSFTVHSDSSSLQGLACPDEFGGKPLTAVSADGFAHIGQRSARGRSTSCISCLARWGSRSTSLRASSAFSVMSDSV